MTWSRGILFFAWALVSSTVARAELMVKAPPDGALLGGTPLLLLGAGPEAGQGRVDVVLNGKKVAGVRQQGATFAVSLDLKPGMNTVALRAGNAQRNISYEYQPKAPSGIYRFHAPVEEGDCKACHAQGMVGRTPGAESALCQTCHDPVDKAKYVHGPIGGGQCGICHDPHGSPRNGLLVAGSRELCLSCHDQKSSSAHIESSTNRPCTECHDPHGSEKSYLLY